MSTISYSMARPQSVNHDLGTRFQALVIAEYCEANQIPQGVAKAATWTKISKQTVYRLKKQARERGFDPVTSPALKLEYVEDQPRSGRPLEATSAVEQQLMINVRKDRNSREMTAMTHGFKVGISATSALSLLHKNDMRSCKTTKKPCLTKSMKEARL